MQGNTTIKQLNSLRCSNRAFSRSSGPVGVVRFVFDILQQNMIQVKRYAYLTFTKSLLFLQTPQFELKSEPVLLTYELKFN